MARNGHQVTLVKAAEEALRHYAPDQFDLVTMSFFVSDRELGDLASAIRQQDLNQPILLLSNSQAYFTNPTSAGLITARLSMPFGDPELEAMILQLCASR